MENIIYCYSTASYWGTPNARRVLFYFQEWHPAKILNNCLEPARYKWWLLTLGNEVADGLDHDKNLIKNIHWI